MTVEQWRPAAGYEDFYEVSNLGRVRRSAPGKGTFVGRIVRPQLNRGKYHIVRLSTGGRGAVTTVKVHRLVAATFIGPEPQDMEIDHLDGDGLNNALSNLEYVTHRENGRRAGRMGLLSGWKRPGAPGEQNGHAVLTAHEVEHIRDAYAAGGLTYARLARIFGVTRSTIGHVIRRETWK